jgi:hypothetical protein
MSNQNNKETVNLDQLEIKLHRMQNDMSNIISFLCKSLNDFSKENIELKEKIEKKNVTKR